MFFKKLYHTISLLSIFSLLMAGCQFDLVAPPPIPRGNCSIQPEANFKEFEFSDNRSKYVFVLIDKSYQHTNEILRFLSEDILPMIQEGDRITAAYMDLDATTDSIFLNKRSELLIPTPFPQKPIPLPLTPTAVLNPNSPSTTQGEIQIENEKIGKDNDVILSAFYCETAKWNAEASKIHRQWELDQKNEKEQFLIDARTEIRLLTSSEFETGKLLYDSIYLASQMIDRAKQSGDFTDFALIIFSDMREWRPEKTMDINLKEVRTIVGIHTCEYAIDCDIVPRWEAEFLEFDVENPKFVVVEDNINKTIIKFLAELP